MQQKVDETPHNIEVKVARDYKTGGNIGEENNGSVHGIHIGRASELISRD